VLVAFTLLVSGVVAALAPAWRASRVDPARTLREE
jgi:ABC-type lipoprotein release transport system permease subunit